MMRSLFAGVTGLRTHQTRMDVLGNNISNVNTVGYKKSVANFADLYSDTLTAAQGPTENNGSVNAKQIGLGVGMNSITIKHTQGAPQYTGNPLDLAITGEGYFVMETPSGKMFTRAGDLKVGTTGYLENQNGYYVQGYKMKYTAASGNDPAKFEIDASKDATTGNYAETDLQNIVISSEWYENVSITSEGQVIGQLKKDANGTDVPGIDGKTGIAGTGALEEGSRVIIGQIALATFTNNEGLQKAGTNMFKKTLGSGDPMYHAVNDNGSGGLSVAALEMSNVDLSDEMVSVITTQRGFQANSRIITVSDTLLEELINLKR